MAFLNNYCYLTQKYLDLKLFILSSIIFYVGFLNTNIKKSYFKFNHFSY